MREADAAWSEWATSSFYPSVLDRVVDQKKIRVGMETTYHEPFVYYDARQKKVVGFDVDLANEIASGLGVTVDRVSREWKELFSGVEARELDVVLSAVSITKERARKYGFSEPYLRTGVVVTTRASSDRLVAPGTGKAVGAQRQTTAAETAKRSFPQATFHEYDTLDSAFAALSRAEIDALLSDETVVLPRRGEGRRLPHRGRAPHRRRVRHHDAPRRRATPRTHQCDLEGAHRQRPHRRAQEDVRHPLTARSNAPASEPKRVGHDRHAKKRFSLMFAIVGRERRLARTILSGTARRPSPRRR